MTKAKYCFINSVELTSNFGDASHPNNWCRLPPKMTKLWTLFRYDSGVHFVTLTSFIQSMKHTNWNRNDTTDMLLYLILVTLYLS